jgi:hypothetical protein
MFFLYSAIVGAGRAGRLCSITDAKMLLHKHLCSKCFLETDFITAERMHLNRVAVPCVSDLASHSAPQPSIPSLHAPYLDSLPSLLTPEDDLHVLPPIRTYSMRSLTYLASTPTHCPCRKSSSQIPSLQVSLANTFTPRSVNVNASDGDLRHINCQSSSSKSRARHYLLKELNLAYCQS